MENLDQDQNQNDISPQVVDVTPHGNNFFGFIKSLSVFILLVAIIAASFWVSFLLGKRILMPARKVPRPKIEVTIPEPPASIAALQEFEEITKEVKTEPAKPKPKIVKKSVKPEKQYTSVEKRYYKVQAGIFVHKSNALKTAERLEANGFQTYMKKVDQGWRVQVGAYIKESMAQSLQKALSAKGFAASVIFE